MPIDPTLIPARISITSLQDGNCHIACDWISGGKGIFTPKQAIYLARCLLDRYSNLPGDVIAAIAVDERKLSK
jgi:hypothetical protein